MAARGQRRDDAAVARELQAKCARAVPAPAPVPIRDDLESLAPPDPLLERANEEHRQAESTAILAALDSTRWNRKRAAALLKINYKALLYKMKKLGIDDQPKPLSAKFMGP